MSKIKEIRYPNTIIRKDQQSYKVGHNCDEIDFGTKFTCVWKNKKLIFETNTRICDIYYDTDGDINN